MRSRFLPVLLLLLLTACNQGKIARLELTASNQDNIARLEKQNHELTAKLDATLKAVSLDTQAKCAQQAAVQYRLQGFEPPQSGILAEFTNHFNQKQNKCFVLISGSISSNGSSGIFSQLYDAYEGKQYADFMKFFPQPEPMVCNVLTDGEGKTCNDRSQFDKLVKPYMEQ